MESPNKAKRIVVVLGMHRSGTSVVARGLSVLGVELGHSLLPPQADNIKGFWEDKSIVEINSALMSSCSMDWKHFGRLDVNRQDAIRQRALDYVGEAIEGIEIWGFKDPRTARLLPFWHSVFDALELTPTYCLVTRHPLSVAKSLEFRDRMPLRRSTLLWYQYSMDMLSAPESGPSTVVDYDRFLANPGADLERISRGLHLGKAINERAYSEYVQNFLSRELRHNRYDLESLEHEKAVPDEVSELYRYLLASTAQDELSITSELRDRTEKWRKFQDEARSFFGLIDAGDTCEERLRECGERLHIAVEHLEQTFRERDAAQAEVNIHQQRHQMAVASLERSQQEAETHKQLYNKTVLSLQQTERELNQNQMEVDRLGAEYTRLKAQLNALLNSTSWKITAPVRASVDWLKTVAGNFVKRA